MRRAKFLSMIAAAALTTPVLAQVNLPNGPQIRVTFDGGDVGRNLGQVLTFIADDLGASLPTRVVSIGQNGSICKLIDDLGYQPPCSSYIPLLNRLNSARYESALVQAGSQIRVPDLTFEKRDSARSYNREYENAQLTEILKNWRHLGASVRGTEKNPTLHYQSFLLSVPVPSEKAAEDLGGKLIAKDLSDVTVEVISQSPKSARLYNLKKPAEIVNTVHDLCSAGRMNTVFYYQDWSDYDSDALSVLRKTSLTSLSPQEVPVTLIDTPLLLGPNLKPGLEPEDNWSCKWESFSGVGHATHLAGIIGSQRHGFIGLAPNVTWVPFDWVRPDSAGNLTASRPDRASALANVIDDAALAPSPTMRVFVAALSFDAWPRTSLGRDGLLGSAEVRFNLPVERAISKDRRLTIVAAGQDDDGKSGMEITARTPLSPQNLGDLENVIVVTACVECSAKTASLLSSANYSAGNHRFVHVAAPGGSEIPGWINDHALGAAGGTSQAAAYVAGIAAAMIGYYPQAYSEAFRIKERIQTTARPFPEFPEQGDGGAPIKDNEKLATGIVDPVLALLDPRRHWLKAASTWKSVPIKSLAGVGFEDEQGNPVAGVSATKVLRMIRTPDAINGNRWTIYKHSEDKTQISGYFWGAVSRVSMVRPSSSANLVTCDGVQHPLTDYDDILLAQNGVGQNECLERR